MLVTYLSSVIIWMIIIFCTCCIFANKIVENGWLDKKNKKYPHWLFSLFVLSAVPIVRFMVVCIIIYMAIVTKKEFNEKYGKEL